MAADDHSPTDDEAKTTTGDPKIRVIACGMIAREVLAINQQLGHAHIDLKCLPADFHHHPHKIAPAAETAILQALEDGYAHIFLGYADCGTGGALDRLCEKYGVARIDGPHCFSFYYGNRAFEDASDEMVTTFFITDFLARHYETFLIRSLGLDRHPELRDMYFGNYERALYLAQTDDPALTERAREVAGILGLRFERRVTGYGDLVSFLDGASGRTNRHLP